MLGDVEPDAVGQFYRPHGHAKVHGSLVDVGKRHTFLGQRHRLAHVRREYAVDHEPWRTEALERELADAFSERKADIHRGLVGVGTANHLDQRQHRDRIEEMQADESFWFIEHGAQFLEPNTRRIRRQQCARFHFGLQLAVERLLGLEILEDSLDDQIGLGGTVSTDIGPQPGRGFGSLGVVANSFREQFGGALQCRIDVLLLTVLQCHRVPAQRAPGRDIAAHHARADNVHMLDLRVSLVALLLELALQEEHADQVACGIRAHYSPEALGLGLEPRLRRRTVLGPQVDHRVWGRIVILARLAGDLLDQHVLDEGTERGKAHEPIDQRRFLPRRTLGDKFPRHCAPLILPGNAVDETDAQGLLRVDRVAREH